MPFSPLYLAKLNLVCGDADELIDLYGYTADDCPVDLMPVYDQSLFKNGRPIQAATFAPRWLELGDSSDHIDFDEHGQEIFYRGTDDMGAAIRWDWCQRNAKGDWYVRAFNPWNVSSNERHLWVMFDLPSDEAAFLAAFPEAGA